MGSYLIVLAVALGTTFALTPVVEKVAVRLGALLWASPSLPCSYDECSYVRLGEALLAGSGFVTEKGFLWPPGYPAFLAPLLAAGGPALARTAAPRAIWTSLATSSSRSREPARRRRS